MAREATDVIGLLVGLLAGRAVARHSDGAIPSIHVIEKDNGKEYRLAISIEDQENA